MHNTPHWSIIEAGATSECRVLFEFPKWILADGEKAWTGLDVWIAKDLLQIVDFIAAW